MELLIYLVIKIFVYSALIYAGFRVFRGDETGFIVYALLLGFARVILGLALGAGFLIFIAPESSFTIFLTILPVSTLLWILCAKIIAGKLQGATVIWLLICVAVSVLFDLYAINNESGWGGRGMC